MCSKYFLKNEVYVAERESTKSMHSSVQSPSEVQCLQYAHAVYPYLYRASS